MKSIYYHFKTQITNKKKLYTKNINQNGAIELKI